MKGNVMKTFSIVSLLFLSILSTYAQGYWTQPVQLTFGPYEDTHPTFINRNTWVYGAEEWLAFTRFNFIGSNICLIKTNSSASAWLDAVYYITDDSATNLHPSLAQAWYNYTNFRSIIVWQRMNNIYYRYMPDSVWLPMQALTSDSVLNSNPYIAPRFNGFGVVWERNGQIMFSEFNDSIWSSPVAITEDNDTTNFHPKLQFIDYSRPLIIWEKVKTPDTTRAIYYSFRGTSTWTTPRALVMDGNNRNPSFAYIPFWHSFFISWESYVGNGEIFKIEGYVQGDSLKWYADAQNISNTPDKDESEFSVLDIGIITKHSLSNLHIVPAALTWRVISKNDGKDSIGVNSSFLSAPTYFSIPSSSTNQHPTLSSGFPIGDVLRVWSVWQSDSGGVNHLYGTRTDVLLDVKDEQQFPRSPILLQNYPNPFNPSTTIRFELPGKSHVTLEIYDVIGRNVATLVSGILEAGHHHIVWNAEKFTSGIYFYHLTVVDVSSSEHFYHQAGKAMLLR
jgi:hypothetical protein